MNHQKKHGAIFRYYLQPCKQASIPLKRKVVWAKKKLDSHFQTVWQNFWGHKSNAAVGVIPAASWCKCCTAAAGVANTRTVLGFRLGVKIVAALVVYRVELECKARGGCAIFPIQKFEFHFFSTQTLKHKKGRGKSPCSSSSSVSS